MTIGEACRDIAVSFNQYEEFIGCKWDFELIDKNTYVARMNTVGSFSVMVLGRGEIMTNIYFAPAQGRRIARVLDNWKQYMLSTGLYSYVYITHENGSTSASVDFTLSGLGNSTYATKKDQCLKGVGALLYLIKQAGF